MAKYTRPATDKPEKKDEPTMKGVKGVKEEGKREPSVTPETPTKKPAPGKPCWACSAILPTPRPGTRLSGEAEAANEDEARGLFLAEQGISQTDHPVTVTRLTK